MRVRRWMALVLALALVGAACGDDDGSDAGADTTTTVADTGGDSDQGDADDSGDMTDDAGDQADADDSGDMTDDTADQGDADEGGADLPDGGGQFADCADIQEAIDRAQNSTSADPTAATDPAQLEADLAESIATIDALRSQLPSDLQDDADVMRDAIVQIDEAFAEIDYDVTTLDPSQMVEFATSMMGSDVMAMVEASQNLSNWVAAGCPG